MRIYKNKPFDKWATKFKINEELLLQLVVEIQKGQVDVKLGGNLVKKIATGAHGKSRGSRAIIAYQFEKSVFFLYGFSKSTKGNITHKELETLKDYAKVLLNWTNVEIFRAVKEGILIEVKTNG